VITKLKQLYNQLTAQDKFEIAVVVLAISIAVVVVLLGIAWSRGNDVDYFKLRMQLLEERFSIAEKSRTNIIERVEAADLKNKEQDANIQLITQAINDHDRNWEELYKRLPQLPKNPAQVPQKIAPIRR
jgi:uncharacterized protein YoxC